ncbi:MAG: inorganic phosphate transporter [Campylobacterales bacterium]|nr:inorganic phosphate transporter [Campylobacterales bacterium]
MDIKTVRTMEKVTNETVLNGYSRLAIAFLFIAIVYVWTTLTHTSVENNTFLIIGAVFGAYMAMNIGANDVANNVGPAVGSKALTMFWAIVIAAVFEAAGAFIAGGDVVKTIQKGIIDPHMIANPQIFIWAMTAALLSAALWLNFATKVGAPVSTTHSIVGGVMGAGIAAAGFSIVDWGTMGTIAASWIISPLLGGAIAAGFLYFIKKNIVFQEDMLLSAKKFVPVLVSIMAVAFATYIMLKGFKHIVKIEFVTALAIGVAVGVAVFFFVKPRIAKTANSLDNDRAAVNKLFTIPLIFSAALLSFAHGANDVANAIGPLAAINDAIMRGGEFGGKVGIPFWVMGVGAIGISIGLALYGPRLIKTVGSEITELDQMRAFSIAMAAALTVIIASQLGLPVSSTHIAVGGVFGVGFLREYLDSSESKWIQSVKEQFKNHKKELELLQAEFKILEAKQGKSVEEYERIIEVVKAIDEKELILKSEKKEYKGAKKIKYVKRDAVKKIIAAWIITVPAAATLSAAVFYMIKGMVS